MNNIISTAAGDQWQGFYSKSSVCPDGAGGIITCWYNVSAPYEIYAARLNSNGEVQWSKTVCGVIGTTPRQSPTIISDDKGGAIISWQDWRDTTLQYPPGNSQDIYAARLDADGNFLWGSSNGLAIAKGGANSGNKYYPVICSDGANGAIITWQSQIANGEIYAKKVNAAGVTSWGGAEGLLICNATGNQLSPVIISDSLGGAIIAWSDERNGAANKDIYAKRVDSNGATIWGGTQGMEVCIESGNQTQVVLTSDLKNGAIIAWIDQRGGQGVSAQRIAASGVALWTANGIAITTLSSCEDLVIASNGSSGAYLAWNTGAGLQGSNTGGQNIQAQFVNSSGTIQWGGMGLVVCNLAGTQWRANMVNTRNGETIIAWGDYRGNSGYSDIYAQRIDSAGIFKWLPASGVQVTSANCTQGGGRLSMENDGCDGAILTWMDRRNSPLCTATHDIYGQYIQSDGTLGGISGSCSAALSASIAFTAASCAAASDGTATVNPSGGTAPYAIEWNTNPPQYSNTATGLSPGNYSVKVTDAASVEITLTVSIPAAEVYAPGTITASTDTFCSGTSGNLSVSGNSGQVQWSSSTNDSDFTDIEGGTGTYINIEITQTTFFKVSVGSGVCKVYSASYKVEYVESPNADFTFSGGGMEISFKDNSSDDALFYLWNFDDGGSSILDNPVHLYQEEGIYQVCLTVKNAYSCTDITCREVAITLASLEKQGALVDWKIFPNPFGDRFMISGPDFSDRIREVEILDMSGRTINCKAQYSSLPNFYECSMPGLAQGYYFLKIKTLQADYIIPIMKQL